MTEQRPIGYWLKVVDRLLEEQFASTLEEHGVTRRQWQLLNVLAEGEATVEKLDLAIAPFLAAATPGTDGEPGAAAESSMEHLAELIESEWVEASGSALRLTERGRGAIERLSLVVASQRTAITSGVTEEEYLTTLSVLQRVASNMGYSEP